MSLPVTDVATRPAPEWLGQVRDFVALTKPRITLMVLLTAAGGMWLAPVAVAPATIALALGAMALVVGAANALNMWLERDIDRLMTRTRARPLPGGRMAPRSAFVFALALGAVALPLLALVNTTTAVLGAIALVSYVCVYTPMKQLSPAALLVGAVPGALPPVMGWTAATGSLDTPALVLFAVLFAWQIPHFIAISMLRQDEYERAGLRVLPAVRGARTARAHAVGWAIALAVASLGLVVVGAAGPIYGVVAALAGIAMIAATLRADWPRPTFITSLVYLPVVFAVLMVDAR